MESTLSRRGLLRDLGIVLGASLLGPARAVSELSCGPFFPNGVQQCQAGIRSSLAHVAAAAVGGQYLSQWCWAACIEMVFRYYGYVVPQAQIVAETWGQIVNLPGHPAQIVANLNRPWVDRRGRRFGVLGDVFSANPITAAQDLSTDMPLIIGTMGHAMVLTALTYARDVYGNGQVMDAVVRDPWPGRGRRSLTPPEWYSTSFLVRIRVQGF